MIARTARHYRSPNPALVALIHHSIDQLSDRQAASADSTAGDPEVTAPPVGVSAVIGWTSFEMGLPVSDIVGISREKHLVRARAAIAWLANIGLGRSLPRIGALLGNRHHTTILSLVRKAEGLRGRDPAFALLTNRLLERIEQASGLRAQDLGIGGQQA